MPPDGRARRARFWESHCAGIVRGRVRKGPKRTQSRPCATRPSCRKRDWTTTAAWRKPSVTTRSRLEAPRATAPLVAYEAPGRDFSSEPCHTPPGPSAQICRREPGAPGVRPVPHSAAICTPVRSNPRWVRMRPIPSGSSARRRWRGRSEGRSGGYADGVGRRLQQGCSRDRLDDS